MPTFPFYVPSGTNLISEGAGLSNLGSSTNPFGDIYANRVIQSGNQPFSKISNYGNGSGLLVNGIDTIAAKSLIPGSNISFVTTANDITIAATSPVLPTLPSSTINLGITVWSGTTGGGFLNTNLLINATNDLVPSSTGTSNIGTALLPFSGTYSNQFATTRVSGNITSASYTVDWNLGSSQAIGFVNGFVTGVNLTLAGGLAGSSYVLETYNNASGTAKLNWGTNVKWAARVSGIPSNSGLALDLFTFYYNGTNYLANYTNNFF